MKQALINLINKWACSHEWNMHRRSSSYEYNDSTRLPVEIIETLVCEKCGKIKQIKV